MRRAHSLRGIGVTMWVALLALPGSILPAAAQVPGETLGTQRLQQDTLDLLLRQDGPATACGSVVVLRAEVVERPPGSSAELPDPTGPWHERWHVDRCGGVAVWDVRYTPSADDGITIAVGLATDREIVSYQPSGIDPGRLEAGGRRRAEGISASRTFVVTNVNDSGPGSLTQAILDANASRNQDGPDRILFEIPGPEPHSISLLAPLPAITDPVVLDGESQREFASDTRAGRSDAVPPVALDGSRLTRPAHGLIVLPAEVARVRMPTNQDLEWDPAPVAAGAVYDVVRGDLGAFPVGTGPGESCLAQGTADTTATDTDVPAPGRGFWYVIRERIAGCGTGTYGSQDDGTERPPAVCS